MIQRASVEKDDAKEAEDLVSDDIVDSFYLVGTTERCKERIKQYREAQVDLPLLLPRLDEFEKVAASLSD